VKEISEGPVNWEQMPDATSTRRSGGLAPRRVNFLAMQEDVECLESIPKSMGSGTSSSGDRRKEKSTTGQKCFARFTLPAKPEDLLRDPSSIGEFSPDGEVAFWLSNGLPTFESVDECDRKLMELFEKSREETGMEGTISSSLDGRDYGMSRSSLDGKNEKSKQEFPSWAVFSRNFFDADGFALLYKVIFDYDLDTVSDTTLQILIDLFCEQDYINTAKLASVKNQNGRKNPDFPSLLPFIFLLGGLYGHPDTIGSSTEGSLIKKAVLENPSSRTQENPIDSENLMPDSMQEEGKFSSSLSTVGPPQQKGAKKVFRKTPVNTISKKISKEGLEEEELFMSKAEEQKHLKMLKSLPTPTRKRARRDSMDSLLSMQSSGAAHLGLASSVKQMNMSSVKRGSLLDSNRAVIGAEEEMFHSTRDVSFLASSLLLKSFNVMVSVIKFLRFEYTAQTGRLAPGDIVTAGVSYARDRAFRLLSDVGMVLKMFEVWSPADVVEFGWDISFASFWQALGKSLSGPISGDDHDRVMESSGPTEAVTLDNTSNGIATRDKAIQPKDAFCNSTSSDTVDHLVASFLKLLTVFAEKKGGKAAPSATLQEKYVSIILNQITAADRELSTELNSAGHSNILWPRVFASVFDKCKTSLVVSSSTNNRSQTTTFHLPASTFILMAKQHPGVFVSNGDTIFQSILLKAQDYNLRSDIVSAAAELVKIIAEERVNKMGKEVRKIVNRGGPDSNTTSCYSIAMDSGGESSENSEASDDPVFDESSDDDARKKRTSKDRGNASSSKTALSKTAQKNAQSTKGKNSKKKGGTKQKAEKQKSNDKKPHRGSKYRRVSQIPLVPGSACGRRKFQVSEMKVIKKESKIHNKKARKNDVAKVDGASSKASLPSRKLDDVFAQSDDLNGDCDASMNATLLDDGSGDGNGFTIPTDFVDTMVAAIHCHTEDRVSFVRGRALRVLADIAMKNNEILRTMASQVQKQMQSRQIFRRDAEDSSGSLCGSATGNAGDEPSLNLRDSKSAMQVDGGGLKLELKEKPFLDQSDVIISLCSKGKGLLLIDTSVFLEFLETAVERLRDVSSNIRRQALKLCCVLVEHSPLEILQGLRLKRSFTKSIGEHFQQNPLSARISIDSAEIIDRISQEKFRQLVEIDLMEGLNLLLRSPVNQDVLQVVDCVQKLLDSTRAKDLIDDDDHQKRVGLSGNLGNQDSGVDSKSGNKKGISTLSLNVSRISDEPLSVHSFRGLEEQYENVFEDEEMLQSKDISNQQQLSINDDNHTNGDADDTKSGLPTNATLSHLLHRIALRVYLLILSKVERPELAQASIVCFHEAAEKSELGPAEYIKQVFDSAETFEELIALSEQLRNVKRRKWLFELLETCSDKNILLILAERYPSEILQKYEKIYDCPNLHKMSSQNLEKSSGDQKEDSSSLSLALLSGRIEVLSAVLKAKLTEREALLSDVDEFLEGKINKTRAQEKEEKDSVLGAARPPNKKKAKMATSLSKNASSLGKPSSSGPGVSADQVAAKYSDLNAHICESTECIQRLWNLLCTHIFPAFWKIVKMKNCKKDEVFSHGNSISESKLHGFNGTRNMTFKTASNKHAVETLAKGNTCRGAEANDMGGDGGTRAVDSTESQDDGTNKSGKLSKFEKKIIQRNIEAIHGLHKAFGNAAMLNTIASSKETAGKSTGEKTKCNSNDVNNVQEGPDDVNMDASGEQLGSDDQKDKNNDTIDAGRLQEVMRHSKEYLDDNNSKKRPGSPKTMDFIVGKRPEPFLAEQLTKEQFLEVQEYLFTATQLLMDFSFDFARFYAGLPLLQRFWRFMKRDAMVTEKKAELETIVTDLLRIPAGSDTRTPNAAEINRTNNAFCQKMFTAKSNELIKVIGGFDGVDNSNSADGKQGEHKELERSFHPDTLWEGFLQSLLVSLGVIQDKICLKKLFMLEFGELSQSNGWNEKNAWHESDKNSQEGHARKRFGQLFLHGCTQKRVILFLPG